MANFKEIVKNVVNHPLMAPITDAGKNVVKCMVAPVKCDAKYFLDNFKDLGLKHPELPLVQRGVKAVFMAINASSLFGGYIVAAVASSFGGAIVGSGMTAGLAATTAVKIGLFAGGLVGGLTVGAVASPFLLVGLLTGVGAIVGCVAGVPYGVLTGFEKAVKFAISPKSAQNTAQQVQKLQQVATTPVQAPVQNAPLTVAPDLVAQVVDGFTRMTDAQRSDALAALKGKCPEAFKAAGLVERTADDPAQTSTRVKAFEKMKITKPGAAA